MIGLDAGADRIERIARLNDRARQAMGLACMAVATTSFRALPEHDKSRVRELIETFDAFTADNDPHGERDFGAIHQNANGSWATKKPNPCRETVFWKIDYYDHSLERGSTDPADPGRTRRVLTIRSPPHRKGAAADC